jgi:NADH-quinone oxidoreductase subunit N
LLIHCYNWSIYDFIWVEKIKRETSFEAFKGLAKTEPLAAVATAVSLLSMAGIPLTAGFVGNLAFSLKQ